MPAYGDESFWFNWKELNDSNLANFVQTHYEPGTTYGDFAKQVSMNFGLLHCKICSSMH